VLTFCNHQLRESFWDTDPALDTVLALVVQRANIAGLYDNASPSQQKPLLLHDCVAVTSLLPGRLLPGMTPSCFPKIFKQRYAHGQLRWGNRGQTC
jgi:hypothetical protein